MEKCYRQLDGYVSLGGSVERPEVEVSIKNDQFTDSS